MPGLALHRRVGERVRIGGHMLQVVACRAGRARLELVGSRTAGRWLAVGDKPMRVGEAVVLITSVGERRVGMSIVAAADVRIMREELERGNQYGTFRRGDS